MSLSLSINLEGYTQGEELGIEGLGRLVNGGDALEITPEMEESYFYRTGKSVEAVQEQEGYNLTGSPTWSPPADFEISDTPVINLEVVSNESVVDSAVVDIPSGLPLDTADHREGEN